MMKLLRRIDPELAHRAALRALQLGLVRGHRPEDDPILGTDAFDLPFRNPIGLAAGFDKNAEALGGLARLGFGFVETGTVTPRAQAGNPRPRLFRLSEDGAVVNRMGFNNRGLDAYVARLKHRRTRDVPVGANIGINQSGADPERDYPMLLSAVAPFVEYVVINVSSPNTAGLRDLQHGDRLGAILRAAVRRVPDHPPLLVKIAPDLSDDELGATVEVCIENGVQGLIVSNTTVQRPAALRSSHAREPGGLSGRPLFALSTAMLARAYLLARGRLTFVGVGGIASGEDALTKLKAGATLVQLYTAMTFEGPGIASRLKRELAAALRREGFANAREAVGAEAPRLAAIA